ncbi:MAG: [FeFe] hydrogenase H-cluster radical SAM maturase HydE [Treponema sp.]|nr:[FeFe] hydrogenase H-cluster radical SAM maturase HydE [Treponema sp.]MCL2272759.1 [FeFe] hydrogenase H-cluster radical SAM maturase HydE [Treponema sp.]
MNIENQIVSRLEEDRTLSDKELSALLETDFFDSLLFESADRIRKSIYGTDVYVRGLVEFTNYCKNNCYYCGIRCGNTVLPRYRLSQKEIMDCCETGYKLGFRTFVLQGGEDDFFNDETLCAIISEIKSKYPDCAVTLSIGEKSYKSYKLYFGAGADRYLLRHETADDEHYQKLHPQNMSLQYRKECLRNLKEIGYQVGSGFMVGSPFQETEHLIKDIRFLQELKPEMIGIGPFLTHSDTPFKDQKSGSLELTLRLLAILRLMFPNVLLPATTALGTISPDGRELGLKAGANVVMPNLSPVKVRKQYALYDNKICTGEEAAECRSCIDLRVNTAGYRMVVSRGDFFK